MFYSRIVFVIDNKKKKFAKANTLAPKSTRTLLFEINVKRKNNKKLRDSVQAWPS